MEPREEKLTWETPAIEDYDIVDTTGDGGGQYEDGVMSFQEYS